MNVEIGQVWRDRDKRMSSGNRLVRVQGFAVGKLGRAKAVCVACWEATPGEFRDHGLSPTKIDVATMPRRWTLVATPADPADAAPDPLAALRAEVERLKAEAGELKTRNENIHAAKEILVREVERLKGELGLAGLALETERAATSRALAAERLARELLLEWEESYTTTTPPRLAYKTSKFLHPDAPAPGTPHVGLGYLHAFEVYSGGELSAVFVDGRNEAGETVEEWKTRVLAEDAPVDPTKGTP